MPGHQAFLLNQFKLIGRDRRPLLLWLLAAFCAIGLLWSFVETQIAAGRADERQHLYKDTTSLLQLNAQQIARTIDYIDHLTLTLKYHWRETGKVNLEKQLSDGYFPLSDQFHVAVVDGHGNLISTTVKDHRLTNHSAEDYFKAHQASTENVLRIGKPFHSAHVGKEVISFTRGLHLPDGSFGGVVVVSVEPAFFQTFRDQLALGPDDCMSVRYVDGAKLTARTGSNLHNRASLFHATPSFEAAHGFSELPASAFVDNKSRIVAWQRANQYPLVAAVALAEDHAYAAHAAAASNYRHVAAVVTLLIIGAALFGAHLSAWLRVKKRQSEEIKYTYRLATDNAQEGFLMVRAMFNRERKIVDFSVEDCNERGAQLVGFAKDTLLGNCFSKLYPERVFRHLLAVFTQAITNDFHEDEFTHDDKNGALRHLHRRLVRASRDAIAMTIRDITESKNHVEQMAIMANFDALTALHNRHWLNRSLPKAIDAARSENKMLALLFIDLDRFKVINDTMGHSLGDKLLFAVAQRIKGLLRGGDTAIRIGGDEFTVLLPNIDASEQATQVAARIVAALKEPFSVEGQDFTISASIGASFFPEDGTDAETLLKNADIAMYSAKEEHRNGNVMLFRHDMYERMKGRADCEKELETALHQDQLVLHYQPRVDTTTGELKGLEALVRWNHPKRGMVPPAEFIPFAESTGQITAIGEAVIEKACAQIASWRDRGLPIVPVSVNVSAPQFQESRVDQCIAMHLSRHALSPSLIEVEITESAMLGDAEGVILQIESISASGMQIHIDDFGTGYSSLSMLHRLDLDVLKIDKAFTSALGKESGGEALCEAIVSMAKALNMRVIAEGVEFEPQRQVLESLHVDEIQGYLISRPLPAKDIEAFLLSAHCRQFDAVAA